MNTRKLNQAGVPPWAMGIAMQAIQDLARHNGSIAKEDRIDIRELITACVADPATFDSDPFVGKLSKALQEDKREPPTRPPARYRTWGPESI